MFCGITENSGLCEGPAGGKRWGLWETDGSVRFGSRKLCKTGDTWRGCGGLGSQGGLGGRLGGAREAGEWGDLLPACTLHHALRDFVGGPWSFMTTHDLTASHEAFSGRPYPHLRPDLLPLLRSSSAVFLMFLPNTTRVATPGPLHVRFPLPRMLFLLISSWLTPSLPPGLSTVVAFSVGPLLTTLWKVLAPSLTAPTPSAIFLLYLCC